MKIKELFDGLAEMRDKLAAEPWAKGYLPTVNIEWHPCGFPLINAGLYTEMPGDLKAWSHAMLYSEDASGATYETIRDALKADLDKTLAEEVAANNAKQEVA